MKFRIYFERMRAALLAASLMFAPVLALAQTPQVQLPNPVGVGKVQAQAGIPTLTGCTIVAGSSDTAGECTTTATSGTIVFSQAYLTAPSCLVIDKTSAATVPQVTYTTTASQITLTTVTSAHVLVWQCMGKIGG